MREALERVEGAAFVHLSLDMDVVDPEVAPGVGTPIRGGLSYREAHLAMELVAEAGVLTSVEVVEVNPILDRENATARSLPSSLPRAPSAHASSRVTLRASLLLPARRLVGRPLSSSGRLSTS